jgi:hypothetical protein
MKPLLLVAVLALLSPRLFADELTLKNGDRLTGTIERSDTKTLVIKTEFAGEISIQWSAIDKISSSQPLHVELQGGQMLVGPVSTTDGRIQVATQTTGEVTASKDAIQVIRSASEQANYDAAMERLQHPHLADYWSGLLDTGLSLTRGNSATLSYTLSGKAVRQTDKDKITVYATAIYGKNDNTSPGQTIAHQIQGGVRGDINFRERWFAFATTDFNSNQLQHLNLQNLIAGGVGYHFIKTKNTTVDLFGGAGYNQEYFSPYSLPNATPPPPILVFAAVTQRNAELLVGEERDTKISNRTSFSENFTAYPNISGPSGYRLTFNSTLSTKLNDWLGWQVTFADNYLSNPPFGIKGNDLLLSTGLRLTFGKAAR